MKICDSCRLEVTFDNISFKGKYFDEPHDSIHICNNCITAFKMVIQDFVIKQNK